MVRIKQKGGSAILATLISVNNDFPKVEGLKVLIRPSGEKIGFLFDGEELEKKILEEGEILIKERKPKVVVLNSEKEGSLWTRAEVLLEPIFSEPKVYIFGAGHVSQQLAPLAKQSSFQGCGDR